MSDNSDNPAIPSVQAPDEQAPGPLAPLLISPERVAAIIPRNIEQVWRLAQIVVAGRLAPSSYNDDPARVAVAVLHGLEIGLLPMQAIQSIYIVNGIPSLYGDAPLALVRASGLLADFEESLEFDEGEPSLATCRVRRRGDQRDIIRTFSRVDGMRAGLLTKPGPWTQYRPRMLQMRARALCLRDTFPDVLKGLRQAEEIHDYPASGPASGENQ
jgi:hypothetical protein